MNDNRIVIAHCVPVYDSVEVGAWHSMRILERGWATNTPEHWWLKPVTTRGQPISYVRNRLTADALENVDEWLPGGRITTARADIILWQDSDVAIRNHGALLGMIDMLARSPPNVAAIGVPLLQQAAVGLQEINVHLSGFEGSYETLRGGAPAEVAGVGFGLIATRATAYEAIGKPWFKFLDVNPEASCAPTSTGTDPGINGEDIQWCMDVRSKGMRVFADPRVEASHNCRREFVLDEHSDAWDTLARKISK